MSLFLLSPVSLGWDEYLPFTLSTCLICSHFQSDVSRNCQEALTAIWEDCCCPVGGLNSGEPALSGSCMFLLGLIPFSYRSSHLSSAWKRGTHRAAAGPCSALVRYLGRSHQPYIFDLIGRGQPFSLSLSRYRPQPGQSLHSTKAGFYLLLAPLARRLSVLRKP